MTISLELPPLQLGPKPIRPDRWVEPHAIVEAVDPGSLGEEVEGFLREGLRENHIAMQAHGYKEVMGYLLGRYDRAEAIRLLKRNTRHYAKYQLGWLRQIPDLRVVRADQPHAEVVAAVVTAARSP